jgi:hypothetical protein
MMMTDYWALPAEEQARLRRVDRQARRTVRRIARWERWTRFWWSTAGIIIAVSGGFTALAMVLMALGLLAAVPSFGGFLAGVALLLFVIVLIIGGGKWQNDIIGWALIGATVITALIIGATVIAALIIDFTVR